VDNEETAKIKSIPKLKSDIAKPGPYGITAYPNNDNIIVITGPRKNNIIFACVGDKAGLFYIVHENLQANTLIYTLFTCSHVFCCFHYHFIISIEI